MERDVEKFYKKFKELNDDSFERMISLLSYYFYKDYKNRIVNYCGYSLHHMLEKISDESLGVVIYQVNKLIESNEFTEEIIENKSKNPNIETDEKEKSSRYYDFTVAKYALSDSIEALINNGAKEVIVTKVDGDLLVRYKPYWKG